MNERKKERAEARARAIVWPAALFIVQGILGIPRSKGCGLETGNDASPGSGETRVHFPPMDFEFDSFTPGGNTLVRGIRVVYWTARQTAWLCQNLICELACGLDIQGSDLPFFNISVFP